MTHSDNRSRALPILLGFCMFSTGASGLVNEYALATVTTYILGNSIEQFSLVIACMMLMMGVSGFVQSKMSDRALLEKFIGVETLMALLGGFAPLAIYAAHGYLEHHFQLVHYFFVLAVGFLIGFEIPLVMRIIEKQNISLRANLTIVYAMDYVGAFIGAIIWVKFLLKNFPLTEISFIVAGFNFIVASLTILYFLRKGLVKKPGRWILLILATGALVFYGYQNNRSLSSLMEQRFYEDPIVYKETTRYQHLVITHSKLKNDTRLYINGNTQLSSIDEDRYHDFLVHPAMAAASDPKHVLILGGGDGMALREVVKYPGLESITLVDLDPRMVEIANENPYLRRLNRGAFDDARVKVFKAGIEEPGAVDSIYLQEPAVSKPSPQHIASVHVYNVDAEVFVRKQANRQWDVIIIDLPDPSSIELSKLYSKQFYRMLKRKLAKQGVIAIQATSPFHAKPAYLAIGETMTAAGLSTLPYRQNIPSFGDWGYYLAWAGGSDIDSKRRQLSGLAGFEVETSFITPELLAASFAFGKGELVASSPCVNTLMEPCLLHHYVDRSWVIE